MSSKINVTAILKAHIETLRDYDTGRRSIGDFVLFCLLPAAGGIVMVCFIHLRLNDSLTNVLATAFAIFAALLFNLLLLVYDLLKKEEDSPTPKPLRQEVLNDLSANISFTILLSLAVIVLLVASCFKVQVPYLLGALSLATFSLLILFLATLLMILKRMHNVLTTTFKIPKPSARKKVPPP